MLSVTRQGWWGSRPFHADFRTWGFLPSPSDLRYSWPLELNTGRQSDTSSEKGFSFFITKFGHNGAKSPQKILSKAYKKINELCSARNWIGDFETRGTCRIKLPFVETGPPLLSVLHKCVMQATLLRSVLTSICHHKKIKISKHKW